MTISMLMPMSMTSNNSHHIALSTHNRRMNTEQMRMSHTHASPPPMHSHAALRERPQSSLIQSSPMAFMSTIPQDHYMFYQPVYSGPMNAGLMVPQDPSGPSEPTNSTGENINEEKTKAKVRLARKAELARESRKRKKASANDKQAHYEFLQHENEELKKELAEARAELQKFQKGVKSDHDGAPPCENAPDMGLHKRQATPALSEFSPASSPMSQTSALLQIPSPLDLTKATSEGVVPFAALREAAANNPTGSSSIQFNGKQSAFSVVKPSSSRFSFRNTPVSAPVAVVEDADCESIETSVKKQKC